MKKKFQTRFPTARIKKIMQLDEEVGKIAQGTPIVVSKCLELFMQDLIDASCATVDTKKGKTVNVHNIRECIETHEKFDFLKDICEEATEKATEKDKEPGPGGRARKRKASDEGAGEGPSVKKEKPEPDSD